MSSGPLDAPSPYAELVGRRILASDREAGTVEVIYAADERFTNRIRTVAGAMIAGMLDSVTGLVANAANHRLPDGHVAVHKEMRVRYLRPVQPGAVTGRGVIVECDERTVEATGELHDEAGELVATAEATLRIVPRPDA